VAAFEAIAPKKDSGPRPKRDLLALAKPRIRTGEGPAIGDGIERGGGNDLDSALSDPTLPEIAAPLKPAHSVSSDDEPFSLKVARITSQVIDTSAELGARSAVQLDAWLLPHRELLARIHPRVASLPAWQIASALGAAALTIAVLAGAVFGESGIYDPDDATEAVLDGDALDVIASLGSIPAHERTARQDLALGHAYVSAGDEGEGVALYLDALAGGAVDAHELRAVLDRLDAERPDDELDVLILWPDFEIDEELTALTSDPRYYVRENAAVALLERSSGGGIDHEKLALLNLMGAPSCPQRRQAVLALRSAGKSVVARATVEMAGQDDRNFCLKSELGATYNAISKRLE
jgi:hypothetical protein